MCSASSVPKDFWGNCLRRSLLPKTLDIRPARNSPKLPKHLIEVSDVLRFPVSKVYRDMAECLRRLLLARSWIFPQHIGPPSDLKVDLRQSMRSASLSPKSGSVQ
jgi:hypothetical protein